MKSIPSRALSEATITSKGGWKWTDVIHDLGMHLADVAHQSTVVVGGTVNDIEEAHHSGRIAMVLRPVRRWSAARVSFRRTVNSSSRSSGKNG